MLLRLLAILLALLLGTIATCFVMGIDPFSYLPPEQEAMVIKTGRAMTDAYRSMGPPDEMQYAGYFIIALGLLWLLFKQLDD